MKAADVLVPHQHLIDGTSEQRPLCELSLKHLSPTVGRADTR